MHWNVAAVGIENEPHNLKSNTVYVSLRAKAFKKGMKPNYR